MMRPFHRFIKAKKTSENGFLLNVTVWISSLLLLSSLLISLTSRTNNVALVNNSDLLKGQEMAIAGLNVALSLSSDEQFLSQQIRQGEPIKLQVNGAEVEIMIEDERGKIDLGRFPFEIINKLFVAVAQQTDMSSAAASEAARAISKKEGEGEEGARSPLKSISDLQFVPGVTVDFYKTIEKYITLHAFGRNINPNTASEFVIAQIPGVSRSNLRNLINARQLDRPRPNLGSAEIWFSSIAGPVFTLRTKATLPNGVTSNLTALVVVNQDEIGINDNGLIVIEMH